MPSRIITRLVFIGAHDGKNACLVFVDYWGNEDELFHRVFLSRSNDPDALAPAKGSDLSVCVWDLHLQSFEGAAWIKYILRKTDAPDFHGYLGERLNERPRSAGAVAAIRRCVRLLIFELVGNCVRSYNGKR